MQKSLRSQFCACERYSYAVCCSLYAKLSMKIKPLRWFTVLLETQRQNSAEFWRATTPSPHSRISFLSVFMCLPFPCVTSERRSERIWEPVRAIPCVCCVSCWVRFCRCGHESLLHRFQFCVCPAECVLFLVFKSSVSVLLACVLFLLLPHHRHTSPPQPYFVSERFFCPALCSSCSFQTSLRTHLRACESYSLCCAPPSAYTIATSATQTPVKVHRIITQKTITFSYLFANSFLWLVKWHINTQSHNWHTYRRRSQKVIYNVLLCRSIKTIIINYL